jgi:hypothetical protein
MNNLQPKSGQKQRNTDKVSKSVESVESRGVDYMMR